MAIQKAYNPTTPARRGMTSQDYERHHHEEAAKKPRQG
jgi:hypothetical protein